MAKVSIKIAKRYAKALFELCDVTELDSNKNQLSSFLDAWTGSKELQEAVSNPAYPIKERVAVVIAVAEKAGTTEQKIKNILSLLVENHRLGSLKEIVEIFASMIDALKKALSLKVTSAFAVPTEEVLAAKEAVQKAFGGLATISWEVDSSLIGGIRIQAGDKVLDNSIKNSLDKIRAELAA